MVFSTLATRTISTPFQDAGRGGATVDRIVLHHMASTDFEGVLSMWHNATREGSANYAVSNEGLVVGAVDEANRSWSLSNYGYDARSITFEIENQATGGSWPVSDAAHEAVARMVADICKRRGIPCDRTHVVTHREVAAMGYSYATACPGGLDADRIVARANQLAGTNLNFAPEQGTDDDEMITPEGLKQIQSLVRAEILNASTVNLYRNNVTESIAIADVSKGFWREFSSMPDMNTLKSLGVFDPDENLQNIDPSLYTGIKGECVAAAKRFLAAAQSK